MSEPLSSLSTFYLTGEMPGDLTDIGQLGLRPALFSAYQDLSKLRYDYPLVLVNGEDKETVMRSLSDIIDDVLQEIAPRGIEGERIRKHVLGLESEIRTLVHRGNTGTLLQLWDLAAENRLSAADDSGRKALGDSLNRTRGALRFDGELIDCDDGMPVKVLTHAWTVAQANKARRFLHEINDLTTKLSNILKADSMKSKDAFGAETLKRSVGSAFEDAFDFEAMSDILGTAFTMDPLPEKRRRRIRSALSALKSQRFFELDEKSAKKGRRKSPHGFVFNRCSRALEAFQERLPEMVELVKTMAIARLEIESRYKDSAHDSFFRRFDERFLEPADLARFPSYLVCLRNGADAKEERAKLSEVLSSGLPIRVLVQNDDILEQRSIATGGLSFGIRSSQLATMALGFDGTFVLQAGGSGLYRFRESILAGLTNNGSALFNVFSGLAGTNPASAKNAPDMPLYLRAAAAMESRAFPAFVYDPSRGSDWASRFSVDGNSQADADWSTHRLCYEDEDCQRISEETVFTFVDFAAADERYAGSFLDVPRSEWRDDMVPVNVFLELDADAVRDKVPYILMIDEDNILHKVIVEVRLIDAARRCREMWRSLQELGGINNSHARKLLAKEKDLWKQEKEQELTALMRRPGPGPQPPEAAPLPPPPDQGPDAAAGATEAVAEELPSPPSDEPYIETPRCTTCDECTEINNRMFVYDDNMQASIADPNAGTYRQLVEAAESCQVAIIHPGKPINPDEPNLDELMARAEPFN